MSSPAILEQKKQVVSEIVGKMQSAQSFVLVDYKGINVEQVTALRAKARAMGVDYHIYKNSFLTFAAKECGYDDLETYFVGTTAVAFCDSDAIAPAKLIAEFVKDNRLQTLTIKGGVIDKKISDAATIEKIAKLPSKEILLAKMLGSLNSPISNLAYVLNAIKDQKETEASA